MKQIKWNSTKEDDQIISDIVKRADALSLINNRQDLEMDITAVHLNDTPIRLKDLLEADDFNFTHDVIGITNNINRKTGKLENCFFAKIFTIAIVG